MSKGRIDRWVRSLAATLVLVAVAACHSGDGHSLVIDVDVPTGPTGNADIEGVWDASLVYESGSTVRAVLVLDQAYPLDWEVFGTITSRGVTSDLLGTISGRSLYLNRIPRRPCAERMELSGTVDEGGARAWGSLVGTNCDGEVGVEFHATRR